LPLMPASTGAEEALTAVPSEQWPVGSGQRD
jgi:hypothetical protein